MTHAILLTVFIVIFIATAAITLLGITNRLVIRDRYLMPLFSSLILEVGWCIVLLFKLFFLTPPPPPPPPPEHDVYLSWPGLATDAASIRNLPSVMASINVMIDVVADPGNPGQVITDERILYDILPFKDIKLTDNFMPEDYTSPIPGTLPTHPWRGNTTERGFDAAEKPERGQYYAGFSSNSHVPKTVITGCRRYNAIDGGGKRRSRNNQLLNPGELAYYYPNREDYIYSITFTVTSRDFDIQLIGDDLSLDSEPETRQKVAIECNTREAVEAAKGCISCTWHGVRPGEAPVIIYKLIRKDR